jgi:hypothetical protein
MPTFETPQPVNVEIDLYVGNVTITAEDRTDTVVTVTPTNPDNESDVEAAEQTRVELSHGTVTIKGLKLRKYVGWSSKSRSIDMAIALPTGSSVSAGGVGSMVNLRTAGRLGACEFKIGMGQIVVDQAGPVKLRTTGDIVLDRAHGDVNAVTSTGSIRIKDVREGAVDLKTAMGEIEVGVAEGTAAWLDAHTGFGNVRNQLNKSEPKPGESTVKVRARTSYGDIVIHRSSHS